MNSEETDHLKNHQDGLNHEVIVKVTVNCAGGCWHSKFITLVSPKP